MKTTTNHYTTNHYTTCTTCGAIHDSGIDENVDACPECNGVAPTTTTKRGDKVTTEAGAEGLFVGRSRTGTLWIAYRPRDFAPMCAAFDAH